MTTISVWEQFSDYLKNFILQKTGSAVDSDDILQEVFLKVHKNLHRLAKVEKLESWLFRITRNTIADFYNKRGKELKIKELSPKQDTAEINIEQMKDLRFLASKIGLSLEEFETQTGTKLAESPEEALDFFKIICPFLESIDPKYAEAVFLVDWVGISQKELSERLGISLSGAKSRVQRGREHLKTLFLQCCEFEFDSRGQIINYQKRNSGCGKC